jgi:hypothetical protein
VIYCVVPAELAEALLPQLEAYYAGDENVEVIVDRRSAERRTRPKRPPEDTLRELRDRRRARIPGELLDL